MALRSLAKDHKELVASEGLRPLIATLSKDREDLETLGYALETLLNLFMRDEKNVRGPIELSCVELWAGGVVGDVSGGGRGRGGESGRREGGSDEFLEMNGALIFDMWGCSRRARRILHCG